jgi:hypothetical protein
MSNSTIEKRNDRIYVNTGDMSTCFAAGNDISAANQIACLHCVISLRNSEIDRLAEQVDRLRKALLCPLCKGRGFYWRDDGSDQGARTVCTNCEAIQIRQETPKPDELLQRLQNDLLMARHDLRATAGVAETLLRERDEARELLELMKLESQQHAKSNHSHTS